MTAKPEPQWSAEKRPTVVTSKPANGRGPELGSFLACFVLLRQVRLFESSSRAVSQGRINCALQSTNTGKEIFQPRKARRPRTRTK
jgi:hypothetical protein